MPLGDDLGTYGVELRAPEGKRLAGYASAWWDLRLVGLYLLSRSEIDRPDLPQHFPTRRALWDAAVVTYGRCFNGSSRNTDIDKVVETMSEADQDVHRQVLYWRNHHAAHRLSKEMERTTIHMVWRKWGEMKATVRLHISSLTTPEETDLAERFADMSHRLANLVWEERLYPIHGELLEKLGPVRLQAMSRTATPYSRPVDPIGTIGVTIDVGEPVPDPPKPHAPMIRRSRPAKRQPKRKR